MKSPQLFYSLASRFLYDALVKGFSSPMRREALRELAIEPGEKVLVAGAGTGLDFCHLPDEGQIIAFDLNEGMLKQARKRRKPNVEIVRADCHSLPFVDESIDKAYCFLIVSIIPDPKIFFAELHRVLKPGAKVVVFDKFYQGRQNPLINALNFFASRIASNINFNFMDFFGKELTQSFKITANEGKALFGYFRLIHLQRLP